MSTPALDLSSVTRGAALIGRRCNPYGAENGGPRRIMGGLYSGKSAATPDMDLPDNVAEGEWSCPNLAEVRCRMTCRHGHRGQVMELCSWHDEVTFHGEHRGNGVVVQVPGKVRTRGHFEEIQRRQSGFCPRCGFPPSSEAADRVDYGALQKEWEGIGQSLHALYYGQNAREWYGVLGRSLRNRREDIGRMFDEARTRGIVHNCPLTLVPVNF
jgi:hypothetical protein